VAAKRKTTEPKAEGNGKLSPTERRKLKAAAEGVIDQYMLAIGCPDPAKFTDEDGWRRIIKGSAKGGASIQEMDGQLFLRVIMEVMPLPADRDLILPLMRELLELNLNLIGSYRLGITNDTVFAGVTRHLAELDAEQLVFQVDAVAAFADALDDDIKKKYEGTSLNRAVPAP
jgi:hypothetical protein